MISSTLLVCLIGVGAYLVQQGGLGVRLGARPMALAAPFTTEEAWVVDEIVRDITEMSAFPAVPSDPDIRVDAQAGVYFVAINGGTRSANVDLRGDLWSPAAFAVLAREAFASAQSPEPAASTFSQVYPSLLELTPATLVAVADRVSEALRANVRNAAAHEAAALTLAGFALRDSAARMGDTRWAMNRMTAHLAIASTLRGEVATGVDGQLAQSVLDVLTNRHLRATRLLNALDAAPETPTVRSWTRAIRLRMTEDWRLLKEPARATRLEQREYFRSRRATVRHSKGTVELQGLGTTPAAEWVRLINGSAVGVEDGWLITEAMEMERAEYRDVYMRMNGRPMANEIEALNTPATRAVFNGALHVLPWGAWAEFAQRHMSVVIGRYDSFLRHSLGTGDSADTEKLKLKRDHGELWIFPAATLWWTKGPRGLEADLRYINETVDEVLVHPHRVTAMAWSFLETGTKFERVRRGIPPPAAWFFAPAPRTAYQAAARVKDSGHPRNAAVMEAMIAEAPYDYLLVSEYLTSKYGHKTPFAELERLAGERMHYDMRPVTLALEIVKDDDRRLLLLASSCDIASSSCAAWGAELAKRGRDDEAARAYERAFADPALDAVALSNWSGWLVQHYLSRNRIGPALQLAERSASTGSFAGVVTAAQLYERLGRDADAERTYQRTGDRYDNVAELLGFYYRAVEIRNKSEYADAWALARERVFPDGLDRGPLAAEKPARGIYIESDTEAARQAGLRAGDIIVAVDGWHVENMAQYRAARAFPLEGKVAWTVWRGNGHTTIEVPDKRFVPEFRVVDYPIRGWIER
jgi:hypothetical protein